jgi:hypothetical protein
VLSIACGGCSNQHAHGSDAPIADGPNRDGRSADGSSPGASLLQVSSNKRYLVDASHHPFYVVGDTAWCLVPGLTVSEANSYFQARASEGFNAVLMDADVQLAASPVGAPGRGPADVNGNEPFNGKLPGGDYDVSMVPLPGDTTSTAARYWANVDAIITAAANNGIQIIFDVYDNYNPWFGPGSSPNSLANLTTYGRFLGKRYAGFDNIIWMIGNDYGENTQGDADLSAVIQGIRQYDSRHINRTDFGPIVNIEAGYENNTSIGVTEADVREEHHSFFLSGAAGDTYGNEWVWPFAASWQDWQAALTSEGAHEVTYFAQLVNSVPWAELIPDQTGTVFQGVGTPQDYCGAYTADGTWAVAYQPASGQTSQSFIVRMSQFAGQVTARWYDPTAGTYASIGSFANSGTHTFASPSVNSAGGNDFVLVLSTP